MADDRVHFLVAGVQKGGTTTLFNYLEEHPQLQMATRKETHSFDHEDTAVDWEEPDYNLYHALFKPWDAWPTFGNTIQRCVSSYFSGTLSRMPGYHRVFSYVERGMYGEQMERAYRLFRREQILPLLSQDLSDDPQRVLGQVYRFLGVEDVSAQQLPRRLNTAKSSEHGRAIDAEDVSYLRIVFQKDTYLFQSLTGLDISAWTATG
ncbi:sulfotransferase [Diaporthe sp. PMI_573]|nr:sulfotransferase [Diaporthaceae sp. PMI_573]